MRFALVNPDWDFRGSIYFGCREPHLPLEFGYAAALLRRQGHAVEMIDAHLFGLGHAAIRQRLAAFAPDVTVLTTAPTYLFWRCAPPELRVPQELIGAIRGVAGRLVAVGPHGSTTPAAALAKLGVEAVVMGECEEVLPRLAAEDWGGVAGLCRRGPDGAPLVRGGPQAADFAALPALAWPADWIARHAHHHHRFEAPAEGPGAEVEASRGCPYHCTFCAKIDFRDAYRRRALPALLAEIDGLMAQGVRYLYFIDEIFLPDRKLLEALVARQVRFGVQTRLDLWKPDMIDLLGLAGCVSIEAGVESITPEGRARLAKDCRVSTDDLAERLIHAKRRVPFVQANLIRAPEDDPAALAAFRERLVAHGVWANDPVPLFPYPGAPDYRRLWGEPDDLAWERALDHYLARFDGFSDLQEDRPQPLDRLERRPVS